MILVFGGTTEGRKAVEVLEEAGKVYYYSTKTGEQNVALHNGIRMVGAMDGEAMTAFCREHHIRLIVDAAHPFAAQLHQTIAATGLPVVRYERIFPPRDPDVEWIDDYTQVPTDVGSLLATTGVQSIAKLKWLEAAGVRVVYRILNRESSIRSAHQQGASDEQLCFYPQTADAEAMLMKESGLTGGFCEKMAEARARGMRIVVLKRPELAFEHCVDGPHGLRRAVEKLLPEFFPLHSGLTTGTCATAAAVAAAWRLLNNETPPEVPVVLPDGETIRVKVAYGDGYAWCVKEAGDDPDVTDGVEIRASVVTSPGSSYSGGELFRPPLAPPTQEGKVVIEGGEGVGRFTLPGFDYPPGEAAINRGPREMIRQNIARLAAPLHSGREWAVTISVPKGAEVARRTFNPRLGIEGGISIIGVSGIVKPFSEEAFIGSIRRCMVVAKASGAERVVINSGGKSERFVKALYPSLPRQAFVEYGNYVGETLKMAHELGIGRVTLGVMLGKAVKLAAGHLDTHSGKSAMDRVFVGQLLQEAGCEVDVGGITLARELWTAIPSDKVKVFASTVISHCAAHCKPLLPDGELTILLIDDNGKIYGI